MSDESKRYIGPKSDVIPPTSDIGPKSDVIPPTSDIGPTAGCFGVRGPQEVGNWSGPKKLYTNPIMEFFKPDRFEDETSQAVAGHFRYLAETLDSELSDSAEKSAGLRKLLEAQDCMIRAVASPAG